MAFRVKCEPSNTPIVTAAIRRLQTSDDPDVIAEAVETLRTVPWEVQTFKKEYPPPDRVPAGEETFLDLHAMVRALLRQKGAKNVFALYDAYNISRLSELRCCDYPQFAADIDTLFHGIRTIYQVAE